MTEFIRTKKNTAIYFSSSHRHLESIFFHFFFSNLQCVALKQSTYQKIAKGTDLHFSKYAFKYLTGIFLEIHIYKH